MPKRKVSVGKARVGYNGPAPEVFACAATGAGFGGVIGYVFGGLIGAILLAAIGGAVGGGVGAEIEEAKRTQQYAVLARRH
jgi:uncharacterized protein YcfJ